MNRRSPDDPVALGPPEVAGRNSVGARSRDGDESAMWTDDDFTTSGEYAAEYGANEYEAGPALITPARPALRPAIWRRAWVWGTAAVIGAALGAAALVAVPPPYKAVTSVLVTQSPDLPPTDQILTEVALVQSRTVALSAMRSLGLPISDKAVESFSADLAADSVTDRVIQITVKGTNSAAAVSAARATARAFLDIRAAELRSAEQFTTAALTRQVNDGKARVTSLTSRIAAFPSSGLSTTQQTQLATLNSQLRSQKSSLTGLEQAAQAYEATATVTTSSMIHGSQVLDPASAVPRSHLRYPVLYLGGGLLGGLAVGLGLVILLALISRRLRRRDDVARALGGPVQLSVARPRGLRRSVSAAVQHPVVRQIVSQLAKSLPPGEHAAALAVVAVDDPRVPAFAVVSLASSYARSGRRVLIADLTTGMAVGRLLKVTDPGVTLTAADGHEVLIAIPEPGSGALAGPVDRTEPAGLQLPLSTFDQQVDKAYRTADIMLTLVGLDPALGADHLPTWADAAVVMLTAGRSSVMKVHAIGEMIRESGTALAGAILLGADRGDESLGFAPVSADEIKPESPAAKLPPVAKRAGQDHQSQSQPQPQSQPRGTEPQIAGQDGRGHGSQPRPISNGERVVAAASISAGKGRPGWAGDGDGEAPDRK
jgi:capsular polysaccharide biosynthesis protein